MTANYEQFLNRNKHYLKMPKTPWDLIISDAWNNLEAK